MVTLPQLAGALQARLVLSATAPGSAAAPEADHPALAAAVTRVASIGSADSSSLVFAENAATLRDALASPAAAVLATPALAAAEPAAEASPRPGLSPKPLLLVQQPRLAFAQAARLLRPAQPLLGIHPTAIVGDRARLGDDVSIEAYCVLGEEVSIGDRTRIGAGSVIAPGVTIGSDCRIYPRVVIYSGVRLGDRVSLHAGCVLGSDGFGYVRDRQTGEYFQFPQQGLLSVEDDVEIGANTTVDRGALEQTRIQRGAKLDNLVHIGHNVSIGRNVVIAAQTGISGSSAVGEGAILGGQVGIGEHADVGPGVILGGGAGVLSKKKLRGPGLVFWGRPAQPLREYLKGLAALARLARKSKDRALETD